MVRVLGWVPPLPGDKAAGRPEDQPPHGRVADPTGLGNDGRDIARAAGHAAW